ncbi:MAG TPA: hypothetical protein VF112_08990 [Candidatus Dormibacteraeota bacterium]
MATRERDREHAGRRLRDLLEQTQVGTVFLSALMRRQLRLSLAITAAFLVGLGVQPLLPEVWPGYGDASVLGLPLPWIVLGVLTYPGLVVLGLLYVRRAEGIDDDFTDLLQ